MNFSKIIVGLVTSALVGSSVAIAAPALAKDDSALHGQSGYKKNNGKSVQKKQSVLSILK